MRLYPVFQILGLLLVLASASSSSAIVKGQLADPALTKNTLFISNNQTRNICTGVLIHPRVALTAGHCVFGMKPEWFSFTTGGEVRGNTLKRPKITLVEAEPSYAGSKGTQTMNASGNDLGVIVFEESVLRTFNMTEADLPDLASTRELLTQAFAEARDMELVGYGLTASGSMTVDPQTSTSKRRYSIITALENDGTLIRAKGLLKGQTSCFGDSGGPLFSIDSSSRKTLLGILTSISPGGALQQKMDEERSKLRDKEDLKRMKQQDKNLAKGITELLPVKPINLPKTLLAKTCGDVDTLQHAAPIYLHLCWVQFTTGIVLDPTLNCSSHGGF